MMAQEQRAEHQRKQAVAAPVPSLAVLLAAGWVLSSGVLAVCLDREVVGVDGLLVHCRELDRLLSQWSWSGLLDWLDHLRFRPPLPYLVADLVAIPLQFSLATVRLSGVLLHCLVLVLVYQLARDVTGDRLTGALAAMLAATSPLLLGWLRLDFQEPLTTVMVLATLRLVAVMDLRRASHAAGLGVLLGLGVLTKLSYPMFLLPSALLYLAIKVRSARTAANAALALGIALAVSGWWIWLSWEAISLNLTASTSDMGRAQSFQVKLYKTFWVSPGHLSLTLLAGAGVLMAWRGRLMARLPLALLTVAWSLGLAVLTLFIDEGMRYPLPLLPLACVLAAIPLRRLLEAGQGVLGRWAWPALNLALMGPLLLLCVPGLHDRHREITGLLLPDTRDHGAMRRAFFELSEQRPDRVLVLADDERAAAQLRDRAVVAEIDGNPLPLLWQHEELVRGPVASLRVYALLFKDLDVDNAALSSPAIAEKKWGQARDEAWHWFSRQRKHSFARYLDQSGLEVVLYRLYPAAEGQDGLKPPPLPPPAPAAPDAPDARLPP